MLLAEYLNSDEFLDIALYRHRKVSRHFNHISEGDSVIELTCEKLKEVLNNLSNLNRKKNDLKAFLWGFRDYFMKKYLTIDDEVSPKTTPTTFRPSSLP